LYAGHTFRLTKELILLYVSTIIFSIKVSFCSGRKQPEEDAEPGFENQVFVTTTSLSLSFVVTML